MRNQVTDEDEDSLIKERKDFKGEVSEVPLSSLEVSVQTMKHSKNLRRKNKMLTLEHHIQMFP